MQTHLRRRNIVCYTRQVEVTRIEPLVNINECIYCKSVTIVNDGLRRNKSGDIQKFNCNSHYRYFIMNIGIQKDEA